MSIDKSQIIEFLEERGGLRAVLESYELESTRSLWRTLVGAQNIVDPSSPELDIPLVGHKQAVFGGLEGPVIVEDMESLPLTTMERAYQWQVQINRVRRGIAISSRIMSSPQGRRHFGNQFMTFAGGMGAQSELFKDRYIAGMFQKGTLTAGSKKYFKNSYTGNQVTDGLIYDGEPWFDAAHPVGVRLGSSTTLTNISAVLPLTATNLGTALDAMQITNAKDDREDEIVITADTLLTPMGSMHRTAKQILNSEQVVGSGNNELNPFMGMLNPLAWRHLTDDADAWWTVDITNGCGLQVFDSGQPTLDVWYDNDKEAWIAGVGFWWAAAVKDWRFAYSANKAIA